MPERDIRVREPDRSPNGDAFIPDFIAQQQGAADLADFALQSKAGAVLADSVTADGAQLTNTPPFAADTDLVTGYSVVGGAISISTTITDPVGEGATLVLTPNVNSPDVYVTASPQVELPAGAWVHLTGGVRYTRSTSDVDLFLAIYWYDAAGVPVNNPDGTSNWFYKLVRIDATTSDTWLHVDEFIQVPTGAVLYMFAYLSQPTAVQYQPTDVMYLNNFVLKGASLFGGVHTGFVPLRPLWALPWGRVGRVLNTAGQTNADIAEHAITGLSGGGFSSPCAGRLWRISVIFNVRDLSTGAHITLRIKNNTTLLETSTIWNCPTAAANRDYSFRKEVEFTTTQVGGNLTLTVTMQSDNAAGLQTIVPSTVTIDDIGPAQHEPPETFLS